MSGARKLLSRVPVAALVLVAVAWWGWQEWRSGEGSAGGVAPGDPGDFVRSREQAEERTPTGVEREGGYERYTGCVLVLHRNNDGDSFHVRLPDGREAEFRLYFVDTPESRRKSYRDGQTNEARIGHQARYFGISPDRSVELGAEAKRRVLARLGREPFTVFTSWRSVFESGRFFAMVRLQGGDWLHEWLVNEGLARVYTEGARMPDGTSRREREAQLRQLEQAAKGDGRGGWGLRSATPAQGGLR